jgi:hypothetical protein
MVKKEIFIVAGIFILISVIISGCGGSSSSNIVPVATPTPSSGSVVISTDGYGCNSEGISQVYAGMVTAWGDIHSHTTYSNDALEKAGCTLTPEDACTFARDVSLLDFAAITDHAENGAPGQYTQEKWNNMIAQEKSITSSRPFVIFPGFEYTKNTVRTDGTGHKNIICYDFDHLPQRGYGSDVYSLPTDLWNYLNSTSASGYYISIPHHPAKGADYDNPVIPMNTDWSEAYISADLQPLVEIYSRHGSSESALCNDERVNDFKENCSVEAALSSWLSTHNPGYKLGIIGGTDTHYGKPGDVQEISSNVDARLGYFTGGLASVWVNSVDRQSIWNGLKGKNCYATSGARIKLEFTGKLGTDLVPMGGTITHKTSLSNSHYGQVNLHIFAQGEGKKITRVQIFKNGTILYDKSENNVTVHIDYQDNLKEDYAYYRVKVWQENNSNSLSNNIPYERAWSSPLWVEKSE